MPRLLFLLLGFGCVLLSLNSDLVLVWRIVRLVVDPLSPRPPRRFVAGSCILVSPVVNALRLACRCTATTTVQCVHRCTVGLITRRRCGYVIVFGQPRREVISPDDKVSGRLGGGLLRN